MVVVPQRAVRGRTHLKVALMGPSGSGKTYSSLLIARGLAPKENPRICLIDTEGGSGSLYSDIFGPNEGYDVVEFRDMYSPLALIAALKDLAPNYDVIIVDSLSLFWDGPGGILEMKAAQERMGKNSWTAWDDITPIWNDFLREIREVAVHVVATMRTKTKWVVDSSSGKSVPNKVGTGPVARDGIEFEFTTVFSIDQTHTAVASKDRTNIFPTTMPFKPGVETGKRFLEWHRGGSAAAAAPAPVVAKATADPGDLRAQYGAAPAVPASPPPPGPGTLDW